MKQDTRVKIYLALICLAIIGVFAAAHFLIRSYKCDARAVSFDDSEYKLIAGCMVKRNGKWIPLENIRGFGDSD
ncbi:hypothetical protein [Alteromonas phage XX1924]|nr:hypothetical protein [Alteromonas phage XX1924]